MLESIIMLAGVLAGYGLLKTSARIRDIISACNNKVQLISVALIIFIMGINLGSIENFAQKMLTMGWQSLIFAIIPTVFSVIVVYFFSKTLIKTGK